MASRVEQPDTDIWDGNATRDASAVLGDSSDVVGDSQDSAAALVTILFGEPLKALVQTVGVSATMQTRVQATAVVRVIP